jgi:hypothetical protein
MSGPIMPGSDAPEPVDRILTGFGALARMTAPAGWSGRRQGIGPHHVVWFEPGPGVPASLRSVFVWRRQLDAAASALLDALRSIE